MATRRLLAVAIIRPMLWVKLFGVLVVCFAFGFLVGHLPAPTDPSAFWVGNIAATYVIVPAVAGAWLSNKKLAAGAGALAGAGMVMGFYNLLAVFGKGWIDMDLAPDTNPFIVKLIAILRWFDNLAFGHFHNISWLTVALVVGLGMGYLGYQWAKRTNLKAGIVIAAVLLVEPVVYVTGLSRFFAGQPYDFRPQNMAIWGLELILGGLCALYVARRQRVLVSK